MKGLVTTTLLLITFISFSQKKSDRFEAVNLGEIRNLVLKNLKSDLLIKKRSETIYLSLKEDGILLNGEKMSAHFNAKYQQLLSAYEIGTGPNRTILIAKDCTAVGDFNEGAFHGKAKGRLRIEYSSKPFGQQ